MHSVLPVTKKTIAIFLHHPTCSIDSVNGIIKALSTDYHIKIWTKYKVPEDYFESVDLVVFPGGDGDASVFKKIMQLNSDDFKKFMGRGGIVSGMRRN